MSRPLTKLCATGKTSYPSGGEARKAATALAGKSRKKARKRMDVYHCNQCGGYHFTRVDRSVWRRRSQRRADDAAQL